MFPRKQQRRDLTQNLCLKVPLDEPSEDGIRVKESPLKERFESPGEMSLSFGDGDDL